MKHKTEFIAYEINERGAVNVIMKDPATGCFFYLDRELVVGQHSDFWFP